MTKNFRAIRSVTCLLLFTLVTSHISFAQDSWSVVFRGIGTFSSPRLTDLNLDGIGDIILGAGREEFHACDSGVMALDGLTGKLLWHVKTIDNIYGSAALKDLNGDKIEDVIIGGRSAELLAIDGRSGKVLWRFDKKSGNQKWFNFYNAQFIPDQDSDGLEDILMSNGGNVLAAPLDSINRYPGYLLVLSAKDGKVLAKAPMPDLKETYMSVSALPIKGGNDFYVVYGTGGETLGGHLYVTTLSEILKGDLSKSRLLASSPRHGYIAPAVWVDITGDDIPDVVANAVEGKLLAFDGKTFNPIWSIKVPNTEAYSSIATGFFTEDKTPDFLVSYAVGQWPNLESSVQIMVNGLSGKIVFEDSLGFYQTSTPVVVDIDGDGRDEAILSVNVHVYDDYNNKTLNNILVSIDFKTNEVNQIGELNTGSNISTTPWIGDMNKDGLLDIILFHATNTRKPYTFDGMRVHRIKTQIPIRSKIKWGAYMGSHYDGVFK
jgi:outer membrane protein assembly factor BamB